MSGAATGRPDGQAGSGPTATGRPAPGQPGTGQTATGQPGTGQTATGQTATGQTATGQAADGPGFWARVFEFRSLEGALLRYRIFAYIVGVGLATLVFVGIPLQYGAGLPQLDAIVGPIHGFFYIAYLVFALDLARRARFTLFEMLLMVGAGLLPILAFVIERRITHRVRTEVLPRWSLPGRS